LCRTSASEVIIDLRLRRSVWSSRWRSSTIQVASIDPAAQGVVFAPANDAEAEGQLWLQAQCQRDALSLLCGVCNSPIRVQLRTHGNLLFSWIVVSSACPCGFSDYRFLRGSLGSVG
jgi:hypothetical protein